MDEQTARMIQQLKSNPAMLQALMQSRDGQALMQMLSGGGPWSISPAGGPVRRQGQPGGDGPHGEPADAEPGRRSFDRPHQQDHERPVTASTERGRTGGGGIRR